MEALVGIVCGVWCVCVWDPLYVLLYRIMGAFGRVMLCCFVVFVCVCVVSFRGARAVLRLHCITRI
mgnify:CR=1